MKRRTTTPDPHLTLREREVLRCVGLGMTNIEIAAELHLARSTVKSHLSSAFVKLGVSNRTQAAVVMLSDRATFEAMGALERPA